MSLLDTLSRQLGGDTLKQIGQQLGVDETKTRGAVASALPTLIGALARNASSADGARDLHAAVAKDHDGSVLDDPGAAVRDPQAGPGEAILGHVLGSRRQQVETGLGRSAGVDGAAMGKLMTMLAPLVMGALGREQRKSGLDADGLSRLLSGEREAAERRDPQAMGLIGQFLDADGDGDVDLGDVAKRGAGLLGKLFRG